MTLNAKINRENKFTVKVDINASAINQTTLTVKKASPNEVIVAINLPA